jgi:hypothetical protein
MIAVAALAAVVVCIIYGASQKRYDAECVSAVSRGHLDCSAPRGDVR